MLSRGTGRRRGFTLVELLVVIAIIAILVSLLLPAVNSAREAARRVQCQNNVRNLALAVLNYESNTQNLPPSNQAFPRGNLVNLYTGQQLSWITQVLPYIEEQALHDKIDFTLTVFEQNPDQRPEEAEIAILSCPSDQSTGRIYSSQYTNDRQLAKGNYATYVGPEHAGAQRIFSGALISEPQPMRRLKDGASKTIVIAEIRTRDREDDERGAWTLAWPSASMLALDVHSLTLGGPTSSANATTPLNTRYIPNPDSFELGQPPNNPPGRFNQDNIRECGPESALEAELLGMPCRREMGWGSAAPRSLHTGGVNAANLDGSVRFLLDTIDMGVMAQLVCINDGLSFSSLE